MMKATTTSSKVKLPSPVLESDTKFPDFNRRLTVNETEPLFLNWEGALTLYYVESGRTTGQWMVGTLFIRNASSRQRARGVSGERTYAVALSSGKLFTIGLGPHVKRTVTIYVTKDNVKRLKPVVDAYVKGLEGANVVRDRRSSRIAQTKLRRAMYNDWANGF